MSLINQALKLEQQRRHAPRGPMPPMVSHMANRRNSDKLPLLLFGFTGMGMLLAASISAIFYFGSDYLQTDKSLATSSNPPQSSEAIASSTPEQSATAEVTNPDKFENLLGNLSADQLSTVQEMLLRRGQESNASVQAPVQEQASEESNLAPQESDLSEVSRIQSIVDAFSVQGIRKSGLDTRVFLNGKIRRIGDIIDIENGLVLIGFNDTVLIFRAQSGQTYQKTL